MKNSPRVAVVIPVSDPQPSVVRCLEALEAQSFRGFETIVVDSSPGTELSEVVRSRFPDVSFLHSPTHLRPEAARNEGVRCATAPILVFIDPDVCARPDWLERMVRAHDETGEAIVGAVDCAGRRWLDRGIHISKYSKWLPGGVRREVDMGPTTALLVRRSDYDAAGGFSSGDHVLGDVEFSYALRARGRGLIVEPHAIVEKRHAESFGGFMRERWTSGVTYGRLSADHRANDRLELLGWFLVTTLPIRLVQSAMAVVSHCTNAGRLGELATTSPLVAIGYAASLGGEAFAYAKLLGSKGS